MAEDITDAQHAGEEIRKLSQAVEQSPSIVIITDTQGKIEYANPKFTQVTGYALEEILGKTPRILKSGLQELAFYKELWDVIVAGGEWRGEFSNRKKSGEVYWELASVSPVRDAGGKITHFVKVAEDITERKRSEEALRQRTAELEVRNKELDAFSHTVAHDLQNPLSVIIGFAEELEQNPVFPSEEDMRHYLRLIAQHGRKMSNIIEELLLLASVRQVDVKAIPLDTPRILAECRRRLANVIEQYRAEIIVPASWPVAKGYAPWVEEVWTNYISNAIKYGGRPPRVELGATLLSGASWPEEGGNAAGYVAADEEKVEGRQVYFWVRDNGLGLTPDAQARLFVPFTQLSQIRVGGHGLGLSIVRRIVEKLGGRVRVESEGIPGRGCVFGFTLPAANEQDRKN